MDTAYLMHILKMTIVFFHMTLAENEKAIIDSGFKSAKALGINYLESVFYAKKALGASQI